MLVPNVFSTPGESRLRQATLFDEFVSSNGMPRSVGDHVIRSQDGTHFIPKTQGSETPVPRLAACSEASVKRNRSSASGVTDTPSKTKVHGRKKVRDAPVKELSWQEKSQVAEDFFTDRVPQRDPVFQRDFYDPDHVLNFADSDPWKISSQRHQYLKMSRHAEAQRALMQRGRDARSEGITQILDLATLRSSGLEPPAIVAVLRERLQNLQARIRLLERQTAAHNDGRVYVSQIVGLGLDLIVRVLVSD